MQGVGASVVGVQFLQVKHKNDEPILIQIGPAQHNPWIFNVSDKKKFGNVRSWLFFSCFFILENHIGLAGDWIENQHYMKKNECKTIL